ncbi:MAG TPA: heme-binding protein [Candidatus Hydrogenedentes bacterium]|nr:heme-binding protein [Candidatus Hydrogenedentota bacterium]
MGAIVAGVVVVLLGAWTAVGYTSAKGIETPQYTVVREADGYAIREYAGYIRAEVTLTGKYRETLYGGFREVADYIFGNNSQRADIAMTAPVMSEKSGKIAMTAPVLHEKGDSEASYSVAFIMPREYSMETLPRPNNPKVRLREIVSQRFAVLEFGGYATERRARKKTERLVSMLERDGVRAVGEPIVAQYDPPWTPFYMRRNEIHVPVE